MPKLKQYKISRRLGARLFPKTENPKFVLTPKRKMTKKRPRPMSEFGLELFEKQKTRIVYGLRERQFANYVKRATQDKTRNPVEHLYILLETRLDNVVFRLGFAKTRILARQMVSHGHIIVNDRKVTIPSYHMKEGDVIGIREGSKEKPLFFGLAEFFKEHALPAWLIRDAKKLEGEVKGAPTLNDYSGAIFNLTSVIEFYSR